MLVLVTKNVKLIDTTIYKNTCVYLDVKTGIAYCSKSNTHFNLYRNEYSVIN